MRRFDSYIIGGNISPYMGKKKRYAQKYNWKMIHGKKVPTVVGWYKDDVEPSFEYNRPTYEKNLRKIRDRYGQDSIYAVRNNVPYLIGKHGRPRRAKQVYTVEFPLEFAKKKLFQRAKKTNIGGSMKSMGGIASVQISNFYGDKAMGKRVRLFHQSLRRKGIPSRFTVWDTKKQRKFL
jgi:hypothetical protein